MPLNHTCSTFFGLGSSFSFQTVGLNERRSSSICMLCDVSSNTNIVGRWLLVFSTSATGSKRISISINSAMPWQTIMNTRREGDRRSSATYNKIATATAAANSGTTAIHAGTP